MSKSVDNLSKIRQGLDSMITFILASKNDAMSEGCGREYALVMTKLEEARMWAGKALSHFNTGFQQSDVSEKPETFTKEASAPIEMGAKTEPTPAAEPKETPVAATLQA